MGVNDKSTCKEQELAQSALKERLRVVPSHLRAPRTHILQDCALQWIFWTWELFVPLPHPRGFVFPVGWEWPQPHLLREKVEGSSTTAVRNTRVTATPTNTLPPRLERPSSTPTPSSPVGPPSPGRISHLPLNRPTCSTLLWLLLRGGVPMAAFRASLARPSRANRSAERRDGAGAADRHELRGERARGGRRQAVAA